MSLVGDNDYEAEQQEAKAMEMTQRAAIEAGVADVIGQDDASDPTAGQGKKKKEKKEPTTLTREAGKSLLPFSRVQKIIKADKDIPIIAKDATFLISLATEEFIMRLCEAGKLVAEREKRATVQHKDLATVVRKADEFLFLQEIIPWMAPEPAPKRKIPKAAATEGSARTMLDSFVTSSKGKEKETFSQDASSRDVVMNEDGTMQTGGGDSMDVDELSE